MPSEYCLVIKLALLAAFAGEIYDGIYHSCPVGGARRALFSVAEALDRSLLSGEQDLKFGYLSRLSVSTWRQ
jgi:hypothetical protein